MALVGRPEVSLVLQKNTVFKTAGAHGPNWASLVHLLTFLCITFCAAACGAKPSTRTCFSLRQLLCF